MLRLRRRNLLRHYRILLVLSDCSGCHVDSVVACLMGSTLNSVRCVPLDLLYSGIQELSLTSLLLLELAPLFLANRLRPLLLQLLLNLP